MKHILVGIAAALAIATPVFAEGTVTCGDYTLMDNAAQMETIARLESEADQMSYQESLTAPEIHEKLVADCKDKVDVLVIEVLKGY